MGTKSPGGPQRCRLILQQCLAIQLSKPGHTLDDFWMYDSGYMIFQNFLAANAQCWWNAALTAATRALKYAGHIAPGMLLVTAEPCALEVLRGAYARSVLKPPATYIINSVGDIDDCIVTPTTQGQFTPLPEALCDVIMDITSQGQSATIENITVKLSIRFSHMQTPSTEIVYDTLAQLMQERKIYQTSKGYFIVTPERRRSRSRPKTQRSTYDTDHGDIEPYESRIMLMTNAEALNSLYGEITTERDGDRTHQCIQTNLADVMRGGNPNDTIIYARSSKRRSASFPTPRSLERRHSLRFFGSSKRLQRCSSTRSLSKNYTQAVCTTDSSSSEYHSTDSSSPSKKPSLLSRIFRRSGRSKQRQIEAYSAQFPPAEWFNSKAVHLHSIGTQTMDHDIPVAHTLSNSIFYDGSEISQRSSTLPRRHRRHMSSESTFVISSRDCSPIRRRSPAYSSSSLPHSTHSIPATSTASNTYHNTNSSQRIQRTIPSKHKNDENNRNLNNGITCNGGNGNNTAINGYGGDSSTSYHKSPKKLSIDNSKFIEERERYFRNGNSGPPSLESSKASMLHTSGPSSIDSDKLSYSRPSGHSSLDSNTLASSVTIQQSPNRSMTLNNPNNKTTNNSNQHSISQNELPKFSHKWQQIGKSKLVSDSINRIKNGLLSSTSNQNSSTTTSSSSSASSTASLNRKTNTSLHQMLNGDDIVLVSGKPPTSNINNNNNFNKPSTSSTSTTTTSIPNSNSNNSITLQVTTTNGIESHIPSTKIFVQNSPVRSIITLENGQLTDNANVFIINNETTATSTGEIIKKTLSRHTISPTTKNVIKQHTTANSNNNNNINNQKHEQQQQQHHHHQNHRIEIDRESILSETEGASETGDSLSLISETSPDSSILPNSTSELSTNSMTNVNMGSTLDCLENSKFAKNCNNDATMNNSRKLSLNMPVNTGQNPHNNNITYKNVLKDIPMVMTPMNTTSHLDSNPTSPLYNKNNIFELDQHQQQQPQKYETYEQIAGSVGNLRFVEKNAKKLNSICDLKSFHYNEYQQQQQQQQLLLHQQQQLQQQQQQQQQLLYQQIPYSNLSKLNSNPAINTADSLAHILHKNIITVGSEPNLAIKNCENINRHKSFNEKSIEKDTIDRRFNISKEYHNNNNNNNNNSNNLNNMNNVMINNDNDIYNFPSLTDLSFNFTSLAAQKILQGVSINSIDTLVELNIAHQEKQQNNNLIHPQITGSGLMNTSNINNNGTTTSSQSQPPAICTDYGMV